LQKTQQFNIKGRLQGSDRKLARLSVPLLFERLALSCDKGEPFEEIAAVCAKNAQTAIDDLEA